MSNNDFEPPKYWELLNADDQNIYREMHQAITAPLNKKACRIDDFKEILDAVDLFENINDDDKWKRCLVCGIFKVKDMIAVNICQLKSLVSKCKSSINGSLRKIGYGNIMKKSNIYELLFESIPLLKTNPSELRKWTMRYYTSHEKEKNEEKNIQECSDANSISDIFFSANDFQIEDLDLSLIINDNENESTNQKGNSKTEKIQDTQNQEHMTEPETEIKNQSGESNFNFSINNINQPSIFDDKMTNWNDEDNISDLFFNF